MKHRFKNLMLPLDFPKVHPIDLMFSAEEILERVRDDGRIYGSPAHLYHCYTFKLNGKLQTRDKIISQYNKLSEVQKFPYILAFYCNIKDTNILHRVLDPQPLSVFVTQYFPFNYTQIDIVAPSPVLDELYESYIFFKNSLLETALSSKTLPITEFKVPHRKQMSITSYDLEALPELARRGNGKKAEAKKRKWEKNKEVKEHERRDEKQRKLSSEEIIDKECVGKECDWEERYYKEMYPLSEEEVEEVVKGRGKWRKV